jgi:hypothetical protein
MWVATGFKSRLKHDWTMVCSQSQKKNISLIPCRKRYIMKWQTWIKVQCRSNSNNNVFHSSTKTSRMLLFKEANLLYTCKCSLTEYEIISSFTKETHGISFPKSFYEWLWLWSSGKKCHLDAYWPVFRWSVQSNSANDRYRFWGMQTFPVL